MENETHFRKLENMYHASRCNDYFTPVLRIEENRAEITIPVREDFFHGGGAVHGTVYFKALDDAAFFAVNAGVRDVLVLTVSFNIYLIRPVSSGSIKGVGKVVSRSKRLFIAESILYDSRGKEIARGSGSFVKGRVPLTPDIGYR